MIVALKSIFFKTIAFKEEYHTVENIAIELETTMQKADIHKFTEIVTDNISNIKVA